MNAIGDVCKNLYSKYNDCQLYFDTSLIGLSMNNFYLPYRLDNSHNQDYFSKLSQSNFISFFNGFHSIFLDETFNYQNSIKNNGLLFSHSKDFSTNSIKNMKQEVNVLMDSKKKFTTITENELKKPLLLNENLIYLLESENTPLFYHKNLHFPISFPKEININKDKSHLKPRWH
jgi:hypothetical protein